MKDEYSRICNNLAGGRVSDIHVFALFIGRMIIHIHLLPPSYAILCTDKINPELVYVLENGDCIKHDMHTAFKQVADTFETP